MSKVTLAELLRSTPRIRRRRKLSPNEAREEVDRWLGRLQSQVEQAGASLAEQAAMTCLWRSFRGVLAALGDPRLVRVNENSHRGWDLAKGPYTIVVPEYKARIDLSEDMLFEQLRGAAEALDELLATQSAPPVPPESRYWVDDDKLLGQLQPLLGALATKNGDAALAELGLLEERLRARGVEMVLADDSTAGFFTLYDGDTDDYVTVTPALVVHGELRKPGEARRPRDSEGSSQ